MGVLVRADGRLSLGSLIDTVRIDGVVIGHLDSISHVFDGETHIMEVTYSGNGSLRSFAGTGGGDNTLNCRMWEITIEEAGVLIQHWRMNEGTGNQLANLVDTINPMVIQDPNTVGIVWEKNKGFTGEIYELFLVTLHWAMGTADEFQTDLMVEDAQDSGLDLRIQNYDVNAWRNFGNGSEIYHVEDDAVDVLVNLTGLPQSFENTSQGAIFCGNIPAVEGYTAYFAIGKGGE